MCTDRLSLLVKSRYGLSLEETLKHVTLPPSTSDKSCILNAILWQLARLIQSTLLSRASEASVSASIETSGALETVAVLNSPRSPRATQSVLQSGLVLSDIYSRLDSACRGEKGCKDAITVGGGSSSDASTWVELVLVEEEVQRSANEVEVRLDHVEVQWRSGENSVWHSRRESCEDPVLASDLVFDALVNDVLSSLLEQKRQSASVGSTEKNDCVIKSDMALIGLLLSSALRVQSGVSLGTLSSILSDDTKTSASFESYMANVVRTREQQFSGAPSGKESILTLCPSAGPAFPIMTTWYGNRKIVNVMDCIYSFPRGGELYVKCVSQSEHNWGCVNDFRGASESLVTAMSKRHAILGEVADVKVKAGVDDISTVPTKIQSDVGVAQPKSALPSAEDVNESVGVSDLTVGISVQARYGSGNEWFPATISQIIYPDSVSSEDNNVGPPRIRYFLQFEDGDVEEGARRLKIRLPGQQQRRKLTVGEEVDALCEALNGFVLPAVVTATSETDTSIAEDHYRVSFDEAVVASAQQHVRGASRGGSRGASRAPKKAMESVVLPRKYIYAAFYSIDEVQ